MEDNQIRRVGRAEAKTVGAVLADAFRDDPVMTRVQPDPAFIHRYFETVFKSQYRRYGLCFMTQDQSGAAMWLPPGIQPAFPPLSFIVSWCWRFLRQRKGLRRVLAVNRLKHYNKKIRPAFAHYYIHALGVVNGCQKQGIGSALLKTMLPVCDREGWAAYLECSNERNLPLYNRHGFRVIGEYDIFRNGPRVWFMLRDPPLQTAGSNERAKTIFQKPYKGSGERL